MAQLPAFQDMLTTLVGCPSVSSTDADHDRSNLAVIEHLADWLAALGFDTSLEPLPERPDKANLIARRGGDGRTTAEGAAPAGLVLAGHTDTVPFDERLWASDPFRLQDADNRFYGLGACDMKGFFPLVLEALRRYGDQPLNAPLTIVATSDEESTMAGARALRKADTLRAAAAVVGEPTGLMPVYAHKGIMMVSIALQGASGHSSDPGLGCNALDAMHQVMSELIALRSELAERYQHPGFAVQVPTMNLGCLHAGDNPNRICGHAELQIDLRLLPGMDCDATLDLLRQRIEPIADRCGPSLSIAPFYPPVPALETPVDAPLVRYLEQASGQRAGTVAFGTEGPFFQSLGMETVIFGAGSIDQAHQPNEFLAHAQIEPAIGILHDLIGHYCA